MTLVDVIGWTLLHSLWQGAAVALLYVLVRAQLRNVHARYALGLVALAALALAPALTLNWLWPSAGIDASTQTLTSLDVVALPPATVTLGTRVDALLPWLVGIWCAGVVTLGFRAGWQWWRLAIHARRRAVAVHAWQPLLAGLATRFGIQRPIQLLATAAVQVPTLIGSLKPVILFPTALLLKLPPAQLELILAHELCHVRRWDYLVNLGQVMLETLLFYHPAVHWLSARVRGDRELCCDAGVLKVMQAPAYRYAETLADLADLSATPRIAPAANGGVLLERIEALVPPPARTVRLSGSPVLLATAALAVVLALLAQQRLAPDLVSLVPASGPRLQITVAPPGASSLQISPVIPPHTRGIAADLLRAVSGSTFAAVHTAPSSLSRHPSPQTKPGDSSITGRALPVPAHDTSASNSPATITAAARGNLEAPENATAPVANAPIAANAAPLTSLVADQTIGAQHAPGSTTSPPPPHSTPVTRDLPRALTIVPPAYPDAARERGIHGQVEMEFRIATDGSVQNVSVLSGPRELAAAAVAALTRWRFDPDSARPATTYRQIITFKTEEHPQGRVDTCRQVTGTHICRTPDEGAGSAAAVRVITPGDAARPSQ